MAQTYEEYCKQPLAPGVARPTREEWLSFHGLGKKPQVVAITDGTQTMTILDQTAVNLSTMGQANGITLPTGTWSTILQTLASLLQGCFPSPVLAADALQRQGLIVKLQVRRTCRPYAGTLANLDTMEALVLDEVAGVAPSQVVEAWAALTK